LSYRGSSRLSPKCDVTRMDKYTNREADPSSAVLD